MISNLSRANTVLFFCFLIILGLYYGASILIPITFGIFFSTLVVPVSNFLERKWGASRIVSSLISTLILFIGVGLLIFFLIQQLGVFLNDLVERRDEIVQYAGEMQQRLMAATGFSIEQQENLINDRLSQILEFTRGIVTQFLTEITGFLGNFFLMLIYVFLLLINRDKFVQFLMMYVSKGEKEETEEILGKTKKVAHKYLWGRIQVMLLLGIMYAIAFFSYGLEHGLLLLIFGVVITIIPYIGPLLSGVLPVLFMIIFGGSSLEIFSFMAVILVIQLLESYVFEPVIIGAEVQQSPLFVIIAIVLGGAIWGIAGLILFVPIFGILKIIFDHNKQLEPIGFLIGYKRPGEKEGLLDKIQKKFKSGS